MINVPIALPFYSEFDALIFLMPVDGSCQIRKISLIDHQEAGFLQVRYFREYLQLTENDAGICLATKPHVQVLFL